jgi:hypothetical protein
VQLRPAVAAQLVVLANGPAAARAEYLAALAAEIVAEVKRRLARGAQKHLLVVAGDALITRFAVEE